MMNVVTDAHSLLWFFINHPSLPQNVRKIFDKAEKKESHIVIPSIVLMELLHVFEKQKAQENFLRIIEAIKSNKNYIIQDLTFEIIIECQKITAVKEIHDRIIVATAKLLNLPLLTKDEEIIHSKYIQTIW